MNSVLVTLRGPEGDEDLVAPADTSVDRLIPALLEMVAPPGRNGNDAEWELAPPGKAPLSSDRTLAEQGVIDGAVLQLRKRGAGYEAPARAEPRPDDGLLPRARTEALLPDRLGPFARVRAALDAAGLRDDRSRRARVRESWSASKYLNRLDKRIEAAPLEGSLTIAVVSPPGAGGSTVTALLGSLLATLRDERVLAVHADDLGGMGAGALMASGSMVREIALRPSIDGMLALAGPSRLAAPSEPDEEQYAEAVHRLRSVTDLLIVDCGDGEGAERAAIAAADQVVVVCDAGTAEARARARLLRPPEAASSYALVVNRELRIQPRLELAAVERRVPDARGMVVLNTDRILAERLESGRFSWADRPGGTWPRSVRELAVVLASDWGERDEADSEIGFDFR